MTKKCFVLMPFSEPFNSYYDAIFAPAATDAGFEPRRADEIYGPHTVIDSIVAEIHEASVLIAELTGRNPNVNYELGIADSIKKPVVLLSQTSMDIPFDYRHRNVVIYDTSNPNWTTTLRTELTAHLRAVPPTRTSGRVFHRHVEASYIRALRNLTDSPLDFDNLISLARQEIFLAAPNNHYLLVAHREATFQSIVGFLKGGPARAVRFLIADATDLGAVSAWSSLFGADDYYRRDLDASSRALSEWIATTKGMDLDLEARSVPLVPFTVTFVDPSLDSGFMVFAPTSFKNLARQRPYFFLAKQDDPNIFGHYWASFEHAYLRNGRQIPAIDSSL